jgi:hypothetical protein
VGIFHWVGAVLSSLNVVEVQRSSDWAAVVLRRDGIGFLRRLGQEGKPLAIAGPFQLHDVLTAQHR